MCDVEKGIRGDWKAMTGTWLHVDPLPTRGWSDLSGSRENVNAAMPWLA